MELIQEPETLRRLMNDAGQAPPQYQPGPYWAHKTRAATAEILKTGIANFRGYESNIGTSFCDNVFTDIRPTLIGMKGRPLRWALENVYPLNSMFAGQVNLTRSYANASLLLEAAWIENDQMAKDLTQRYVIPETLLGGCVAHASIDGRDISIHYLRLLQVVDEASYQIPLRDISPRVTIEIGSGFGANTHLMVENFRDQRKFVLIDISPNIYVAYCYLKSFYGDAVRLSSSRTSIQFSANDDLEIVCAPPAAIEMVDDTIDLFWNSHSFVEMPPDVVANYVGHVQARSPENTPQHVVLATYDGGDSKTLPATSLPDYFANRTFETREFRIIGRPREIGEGHNNTFVMTAA